MCRSRPFRAGRSAPVVCVLTAARASAALARSAPPPTVISWRGPRGAVRSDSSCIVYSVNRLAPRVVVRFNFYVSSRNHFYKFGGVGPRLRLTPSNLAPPPFRGGGIGGGHRLDPQRYLTIAKWQITNKFYFPEKQCFGITYKLFYSSYAAIPTWNKKTKKYLDAVCIIVYICVCSGGVGPRSKKGRYKMSDKSFSIKIEKSPLETIQYEGIGTAAHAKSIFKKLLRISKYDNIGEIVIFNKDCTIKYWLEYENGTFTKKSW